MSKQKQISFDLALIIGYAVLILSPLLSIFFKILKALYVDYSQKYLTDPGHRRIRVYDIILLFLSIAIVLFVFNYADTRFIDKFTENFLNTKVWPIWILFIQFSDWISSIVLYSLGIVLELYSKNRAGIIDKINQKAGVW